MGLVELAAEVCLSPYEIDWDLKIIWADILDSFRFGEMIKASQVDKDGWTIRYSHSFGAEGVSAGEGDYGAM